MDGTQVEDVSHWTGDFTSLPGFRFSQTVPCEAIQEELL